MMHKITIFAFKLFPITFNVDYLFSYCHNSRAGNSRNPSGGSSNGSNNPGVLPPQFVQVEMTNPDDQQFIVYTE